MSGPEVPHSPSGFPGETWQPLGPRLSQERWCFLQSSFHCLLLMVLPPRTTWQAICPSGHLQSLSGCCETLVWHRPQKEAQGWLPTSSLVPFSWHQLGTSSKDLSLAVFGQTRLWCRSHQTIPVHLASWPGPVAPLVLIVTCSGSLV